MSLNHKIFIYIILIKYMAFEAEIHFLPLLRATLLQKAKTSSADGLLLIAARLQHPGEAGAASSEGISKGIVASCRAQHKRAPAPFVREKETPSWWKEHREAGRSSAGRAVRERGAEERHGPAGRRCRVCAWLPAPRGTGAGTPGTTAA